MSAGRAARAFLALLHRDVIVFLSYRMRLVNQVLTALFSLTLFHYVSRVVVHLRTAEADRYFAFVVVGIALLSVIQSCFAVSGLIRQELVMGTFDRLLLSPFGPVRSIIAMTLFPMVLALSVSTISLALASVLFGVRLHWATVPLSLPVLGLSLLAFMPFGLLLGAVTVAFKQANVGATWIVAGLSLVGGLYFPVRLLPSWARPLADVQPFTPATDMLRHLLVNTPMRHPFFTSLTTVFAFGLVALPLAVGALVLAVRYGQRRATILEY